MLVVFVLVLLGVVAVGRVGLVAVTLFVFGVVSCCFVVRLWLVVCGLCFAWWFAVCVLHGGCCLGFADCCLAVAVVALLFLVGCWFGVWVVSASVLFWLVSCLYVLTVGFRWFRFVA